MPTYAEVNATLPAPPDVIVTASRNEIHATRFTVTRPGTVFAMGCWVIGSGLGLDTLQTARLAIYSHDGGTNRPLNKLAETGDVQVHRDYPVGARGLFPLLANLHLNPGTYWMAIHLDDDSPQAKWNVRGINGGGTSVLGVTSAFGTVPAVFPAGGAASTNRMGIGAVFTPDAVPLTGAIVGTFIVGDGTLVGEPVVPHLNAGLLRLNGKAFTTLNIGDLKTVSMAKSSLVLKGKALTVDTASSYSFNDGALVLNGKAFVTRVGTTSVHNKPYLFLKGKAFVLQSDVSVSVNKAVLYLRGGRVLKAGVAGLIPTTPEFIDLVPTVPQSADLVPTLVQAIDLVPTVEEFR